MKHTWRRVIIAFVLLQIAVLATAAAAPCVYAAEDGQSSECSCCTEAVETDACDLCIREAPEQLPQAISSTGSGLHAAPLRTSWLDRGVDDNPRLAPIEDTPFVCSEKPLPNLLRGPPGS